MGQTRIRLAGGAAGSTQQKSPIETAIRALNTLDTRWSADVGVPHGREWIHGVDFTTADAGPFHSLLLRIGERMGTRDRRTIAASFALRFGWSASLAIAPYLVHRCVPDVGLDNIALRFREDTLFERAAIHSPRGTLLAEPMAVPHPLVRFAAQDHELLAELRRQLYEQTKPVVEALYQWSGFSRMGSWGQITGAWSARFAEVYESLGTPAEAQSKLRSFFAGSDEICRMQPRLYPIAIGTKTQLCQRRASCCRYYLLPGGSLCASCPLVSQGERLDRNLAWMKTQLNRQNGDAARLIRASDATERKVFVRVLVVDECNRVMVVRQESGSRQWDMPGGELRHGETVAQAGSRVLWDNLGMAQQASQEEVAARQRLLRNGGAEVAAEERYVLVRTPDTHLNDETTNARRTILEHRWCGVAEVTALEQPTADSFLATLLASVGVR